MIPVQYKISTKQNLPLLQHIKIALNADCKWIQLRTHQEEGPSWIDTLTQIKTLCREEEATFIIEDQIDLVKAIDGDGIHITTAKSLLEVRQQLGEGFLIGADATDAEDIIRKKQQSADYLCYGPFTPTPDETSKKDLQNFKETIQLIENKDVFLPICAYGMIGTEDVHPILETGMRGISISIDQEDINETLVTTTLNRFLTL